MEFNMNMRLITIKIIYLKTNVYSNKVYYKLNLTLFSSLKSGNKFDYRLFIFVRYNYE